jgi:hypothetical protein
MASTTIGAYRLATVGLVLFGFVGLGCASASGRTPPPGDTASRCFAVADLSPGVRQTAEAFVLAAGDREALYTLDGGLKPMSSDVASFSWTVAPQVDAVAADTLARWREATRALTCGELEFAVQVFGGVYPGRGGDSVRSASVAVAHRGALDATIRRHATFFTGLGVTPGQPLGEVLAAIDAAPRPDRWRGYGLLFGYPEDAVTFFVAAGLRGDSTKAIEPRDFRRLPTWRKSAPATPGGDSLSSFVYAVPKGAPLSSADSALMRAVAPRYEAYRAWRDRGPRSGADAIAYWRQRLRAAPPR